jgi:type IV fimbrial biogenesis protein FimT
MNKHTGFSLVELLIVLVVAGVLAALAAPNMSVYLLNSRLITTTNSLMSDLSLARSEAVKRNNDVIACTADDPMGAPLCDGTGGDWASGWIVFASTDGTIAYDPLKEGVQHRLLRRNEGVSGAVTLASNAAADTEIVYESDGTINSGGATASFAICDDRTEDQGRLVSIGPTGRPLLTHGEPDAPLPANTCANP